VPLLEAEWQIKKTPVFRCRSEPRNVLFESGSFLFILTDKTFQRTTHSKLKRKKTYNFFLFFFVGLQSIWRLCGQCSKSLHVFLIAELAIDLRVLSALWTTKVDTQVCTQMRTVAGTGRHSFLITSSLNLVIVGRQLCARFGADRGTDRVKGELLWWAARQRWTTKLAAASITPSLYAHDTITPVDSRIRVPGAVQDGPKK